MPACEFCGDDFDSEDGLHLHWSQVHEDELNSHQKKQAKQAEKTHRRRQQAEEQRKAKRKKIMGYAAATILAVTLIGFGLAQTGIIQFSTDDAGNSSGLMGESHPIVGQEHRPQGTDIPDATYNSNPPTSGPHWPRPAEWGYYDKQVPDEQLVHNLEHGGTWISYRSNATDQTKQQLASIADTYPNAVIVTERPGNPAPIAVASWGQLMLLDTVDQERIEQFITTNMNQAPEPLAGTAQHQQ